LSPHRNELNEEVHGKGRIGSFIAADNALKIKGKENALGIGPSVAVAQF